ncbi:hypothetical protein GGH20_003539, partial [Coemansia sp. RSA 1937]
PTTQTHCDLCVRVQAHGLLDGTVHWFDSGSGARLAPPLMLGTPATVVRCTGRFCLVLDASGLISVYDVVALEARADHISIAPLLNSLDQSVPALTGVLLSESGDFVVQLTNGCAFAFNTLLRSWLRIADPHAFRRSDFATRPSNRPITSTGTFAAYSRSSASQLEGIQESAHLQYTRMQGAPSEPTASKAVRACVTLDHLEHQLMAAATIGNDDDVVRFTDLLARRLAQTADHTRVLFWLDALLGPPLVTGEQPSIKSWTPCLASVPKRRLLQRMLRILASNRHLQSQVSEYSTALKELLEI